MFFIFVNSRNGARRVVCVYAKNALQSTAKTRAVQAVSFALFVPCQYTAY